MEELGMTDYINVLIRRRYTILVVMLIGMVVALGSLFVDTTGTYQAIGHYKITKKFQRRINPTELAAELRIKHPSGKISTSNSIITIKTSGATSEVARDHCLNIAESLPVEPIVDISTSFTETKRMGGWVILLLSMIVAVFVAFLKEWWEGNKEKICGK